jgi:hypothetical protein
MFDRGVQLRMGQAHVKRWIDELMHTVSADGDPLGVTDFATHAHVQVNGLRGNKTLIGYSMADAPEAKPVRRQLGEVPVVGVRTGGTVHVLADRCSHTSGPLSDSELTHAACRRTRQVVVKVDAEHAVPGRPGAPDDRCLGHAARPTHRGPVNPR